MNIKHENVPGLVQDVVFEINKEDYAANVEAALKKQRRNAQIPGFRAGNAPMGMINKMYGKSLLAEEIDKLLSTHMDEFFKTNQIKVIFEPLPVSEKSKVDFDHADTFEFAYQYAVAPEFEVDYAKLPVVKEFKIIPSEEQIEEVINPLRQQYGQYSTPETVGEEDSISLDYDDGHSGFVFMHDMTEAARAQFLGKKLKDVISMSLREMLDTDDKIAHFLRVEDKKKLEKENEYHYDFTISHIGHIEPAEFNEEFFKNAVKDGSVTNEEELKQWASKQIVEGWTPDLDRQLLNDVSTMLVDNIEMEIPTDFMIRYIVASQKDAKQEDIEKNSDRYVQSFKWQLIENHVAEEGKVSVTEEEMKNYFRTYFIRNYFAQFAPETVKDRLEQLVNQAMESRENAKSVYDILFDTKLLNYLRTKLNMEIIEGSSKDVSDFMMARYKKEQESSKEASSSEAAPEAAPKEDKPKKAPAKRKPAAPKAEEEETASPEKPKAAPKPKKSTKPASDDQPTK